MNSWQKALAIALGIPSTILGIFFGAQKLVSLQIVTQLQAQAALIIVVLGMLIKMIMVSWKRKK
jgi:hypothetical protein